jgi:Flp pilus assembly protein TadG
MGWLVKLTVLIVVVAVLLFDSVSLALNPLRAQDEADAAALAAAQSLRTSQNGPLALEAARKVVAGSNNGSTIPEGGFVIDQQGRVTVKVRREARTLVVGWVAAHVSAIEGWTSSEALATSAQ